MAQNTNSASSLRLQPNKSNNIGNIVQEYIRYNRKYEDDKTAREKIEKAREAEFKFKIDGRTDKLLEALRPDDTVGYFNSQVAEAFTEQQDYLRDLAQRKANGDLQASIQYDKELTKWRNLAQAGKAFKDKIASNVEARKKNGFNPILDESYLNLEKSLLNGGLVLDRKTLETKIVSADGTDVILPASKITSNEFFTHQFNPLAKFQGNNEYGNAIAQSVYGENPNISDKDAKLKGINAVRNIFATDTNELNSWYGTYLKRQGINPRAQDPYSKLDLQTKLKIQESYLNEFAPKPVKTIKEKQAEANLSGIYTRNKISRKNLDLLENPPIKKEKEKTTFNTISIKKDPVTRQPIRKESGTGEVFEVALPTEISYGGNTNAKGLKIQSATVDEYGNVFFNGVKPNGESITISDPQEVGDIVTKIPNGNSKDSRFKDVVEFSKKANDILNPKKENIDTSKMSATERLEYYRSLNK